QLIRHTAGHKQAATDVAYFNESDFYFLCHGNLKSQIKAFVERFSLQPNPSGEMPDTLKEVLATNPEHWIDHIDAPSLEGTNLYLRDPSGKHFMLSLRAKGFFVLGVPYTLLNAAGTL